MALILRIDALLRRELPTADMVPSAQQLEQRMLQQDKGASNSAARRDTDMADSSNSGEEAPDGPFSDAGDQGTPPALRA